MSNCFIKEIMKPLTIIVLLLITVISALGQNFIDSDSVIYKKLEINESFDLQFVDRPSPGMLWSINTKYDSTMITIKEISSKLMEGDFPIGGRYVKTVEFTGIKKGEIVLEYSIGRPWIKEILHTCQISIEIE
jgi:predicted secreted protein